MAEVGDKLVNLNSLRAVFEAITVAFENYCQLLYDQLLNSLSTALDSLHATKLNTPNINGTIGQVLTLKDNQGNTEWKDMPGNVDVVRQSTHHTDYTRDTLEFVTDSTGKVTNVYFMSKQVN